MLTTTKNDRTKIASVAAAIVLFGMQLIGIDLEANDPARHVAEVAESVQDQREEPVDDQRSRQADAGTTADDPEPVTSRPGVVTANPDHQSGPASPPPATEPTELLVVSGTESPSPTPPSVNPIDLLEVGTNGLTGPVFVIPDDQLPSNDGIDGLATNVTGCALQCVLNAILTPNVTSPSLDLDVEVAVPARIDITMTNIETGLESLFTSGGFKTSWSTTLSPLAAGTEYHLVLEATDQDGQREVHTHTLTTTSPVTTPGQLQDNQPGCAGTCITQALVTPTDRPDEVRIDINTNTPASVKVWLSADEPGWIDDVPFLPADSRVEPTLGIKTEFSVERAYLDHDTTYHVIVQAEDDFGVEYAVGQFHMGPPPPVDVLLTFELIYVKWDGDPGPINRGELSFVWGLYDGHIDFEDEVGRRSEQKMDGGTIVNLGGPGAEVWQTLEEGESFLSPGVTAYENDHGSFIPSSFGAVIPQLVERPRDHGSYGRSNPAWGPRLTLDQIKAQETCGEMGVESALPDDFCVSFTTQALEDPQYPEIQVIVSYRLVD